MAASALARHHDEAQEYSEDRRSRREDSDKKRKVVQDKQSEVMIKRRAASISVKVGNVVRVKVDVRDRSKHISLGLLGCVMEVASGASGGVKVATRHGVLSLRATRPFFIPLHQYQVIDLPVLDDEMKELQRKIIEHGGKVSLPLITVAGAHKAEYATFTKASEVSRAPRKCRCKDGECNNRCGC